MPTGDPMNFQEALQATASGVNANIVTGGNGNSIWSGTTSTPIMGNITWTDKSREVDIAAKAKAELDKLTEKLSEAIFSVLVSSPELNTLSPERLQQIAEQAVELARKSVKVEEPAQEDKTVDLEDPFQKLEEAMKRAGKRLDQVDVPYKEDYEDLVKKFEDYKLTKRHEGDIHKYIYQVPEADKTWSDNNVWRHSQVTSGTGSGISLGGINK